MKTDRADRVQFCDRKPFGKAIVERTLLDAQDRIERAREKLVERFQLFFGECVFHSDHSL